MRVMCRSISVRGMSVLSNTAWVHLLNHADAARLGSADLSWAHVDHPPATIAADLDCVVVHQFPRRSTERSSDQHDRNVGLFQHLSQKEKILDLCLMRGQARLLTPTFPAGRQ